MINRLVFSVLSCAFALLGLPRVEAQEPLPAIRFEKDITYSKHDDREMQLDIAYPNVGKQPRPAVICIHGGAWRFGKRQDLSNLTKILAQEGYVALTISYRLIPEARFPAPLEDCKTAVRWLRANAAKYGVDPDRIGTAGFSAGAHLACLLGTTTAKNGFEGKEYLDQSSKVQAVVSFFGPTDLTLYGGDQSAENTTFLPLLGARYKDKPELYQQASPITYVSRDSPPFLLLHGTKDWLVPIEHSRAMMRKLKEAGVKVQLIEVPGEAHGWSGQKARESTEAMIKFLAEHLKK